MATLLVTEAAPSLGIMLPAALLAEPDWDSLVCSAAEPNAFLEPWFLKAALTHLALDPDVRFAVLRDGNGEIIGLMGLTLEPVYARMPIAHVCNHIHATIFLDAPLIRAGFEAVFWSGLIDALDASPWARGLLLLRGLVEGGPAVNALNHVMEKRGRACDAVYGYQRALLEPGLSTQAYYEANVRKKKRKEINRLRNRLAEQGAVSLDWLTDPADAAQATTQFLALEQAGWKGAAGSALGQEADKRAFFSAMVLSGMAAGRVEVLRLSLDDTPLAVLVNFMSGGASFSFKIAYDESFSRYSPGVLIELENLKLLEREGFRWMDSCAAPDHPMIDSLWSGRREIVWKAVPLKGTRRSAIFRTARLVENSWAAIKRLRARNAQAMNDNRTDDND